ncbi:MAG: glyoxalase [Gammaproteobacteria bacterium RBG_16_57_12]|nr:MAG: glyoxalase [Gammaproteobacteria bacterium RBG_16_57_12]
MNIDAMKQHGAFSWNELLTTDVAGAKAFYGALLGWTLEDMKSNGKDYTIAKAGAAQVGGIMAIPAQAKGMPPAWGAYVTVNNVDALIPQVKKLGGSICVPPMDIPGLGRFMVIQDPQGATLSLITYI